MLLTGTFRRSIDDKLRVAIPKALRAAMQCPEGGSIFVAPGTDGSLALYTEEAFAGTAERIARGPPTRADVRAYTRLFFARAQRVEVDAQGRVRIPVELAEVAGLERDAVLLGVQDRLELWAPERWEAYLAQNRPDYDQIAETALGGPPGN